MTGCKKVKKHLIEYYYDELDAGMREKIEEHLKSCTGCRSEFEATRQVLDKVLRSSERDLSRAVQDRIKTQVRSKIERPDGTPVRFFTTRWIPVVASIMVVLFAGTATFHFLSSKNQGNGDETKEIELEVAENLEMLENMELIEILDALLEITQPQKADRNGGGEL
jgi:anti-sigma factor RsiW